MGYSSPPSRRRLCSDHRTIPVCLIWPLLSVSANSLDLALALLTSAILSAFYSFESLLLLMLGFIVK